MRVRGLGGDRRGDCIDPPFLQYCDAIVWTVRGRDAGVLDMVAHTWLSSRPPDYFPLSCEVVVNVSLLKSARSLSEEDDPNVFSCCTC